MNWSRLSVVPALLLSVLPSFGQDVFVPPVPIGILRDGKRHVPKEPIPFPAETETWIRVRSPHFDILSSATESKTRAMAENLETLAAALTGVSARFQKPRTATTIFVFADRKESQPYFDLLIGVEKTGATGVFVRHSSGGTMFVDASRKRVERTAMHELVHALLRQSDVVPPLWIEEGLAEYFSATETRKDVLVAGQPIAAHEELLMRSPPRTLETLFGITTESAAAASPHFYAQSWAAVSWLMRLGQSAFYPFLQSLEHGATVEQALRMHYGKSLDELLHGVQKLGRHVVKIPRAAPAAAAIEAKPLERAALLYELGRFLGHVEGAEKESERHLRGAIAVDANYARAWAALGDYERAVAADPNDAQIVLDYAESLLKTAIGPFAGVFEPEPGDAAAFRKARTLGERALALGGDEARAQAVVGTSWLVEEDVRPGIAALERARALAPSRMDVALHLYDMYLRVNDRARADALFAATFARPRDTQTAFAARTLLLRVETQRANELARAGKLDEAAAVVKALAAATDDVAARRELEQQAAQLVTTAAVNRHIAMYNEAIVSFNAGRKREALKILDELLAVATDPQVVRDAQRLRREVRGK
ncbi:MAG TPA: hypothetical protein VF824_13020 [Thermoanaerobaculia bacterium]